MPPANPVKILFVGDVHLGRRVSRVPDNITGLPGLGAQELGPLGGLRGAVALAKREQVQAVAFAGDLIHSDSNLFEARGILEEVLGPLHEDGIRVVMVAGNHDTRILPLLAANLPGLELLGPGGTWTTVDVAGVRLAGWSFPDPHHRFSPLQEAPPTPEPGTVTIGLLHTDRDVSGSRYAPVTTGELRGVGYDGWALGHIHLADPVPPPNDPGRPFYLGSLGAVPPTETGPHGPVLATIRPDGSITWERRTIAPLRWEHVAVSVDALSPDDVALDPANALRKLLLDFAVGFAQGLPDADRPAVLGLRITLTGAHTGAVALQQAALRLNDERLTTAADGCHVFVDRLTANIATPVDLTSLARRADLPGLLARRILALTAGGAAGAELVRRHQQRCDTVALPAGLPGAAVSADTARADLLQAGHLALNALLAQHEAGTS